ncbi:MAG: NAD(P)-dependent oxidoreductase [Candidatus Competibacteraceae bacterium]|jgi:nucleoside-diphosphate-sugar epimerase|nr:NAD(P)-dependent oxidoreductase [Candidatus Competibacteraceae bacterium]
MSDSNRQKLPVIIVTGASGFVGRYFIEQVKDDYTIYAIARRSQRKSEVADHPNINWMRLDIGEEKEVARAIKVISEEHGSVDFVFHFAGYYDFTYKDVPEYHRTNVQGTENLLKGVESLKPKRFIFSSSLAITDFSDPNRIIDERSPADADYPYATSKREAEELVKQFSSKFPCTIVRLAAIYSDWCEYGPLYALLNAWLKKGWMSKIVVGRGKTGIPFLHVVDLNNFMLKIIEKHDQLGSCDVLIASDRGCVSHNRLFDVSSKYFYGETIYPVYMPVFLASIGVIGINLLGKLLRKEPFEKLWMLTYIDQRMEVDPSKSHEILDWKPKPRYDIKRRLLFLIENMKYNPQLWTRKNIAMAIKHEEERPGLKIFNVMLSMKEKIIAEHVAHISSPENNNKYPNYQKLDKEELISRATYMYEILEIAILNGHRTHTLSFSRTLAQNRFKEGFGLNELISAFSRMASKIEEAIRHHPELLTMQQRVHDKVMITMQLIVDEIEDVYENLSTKNPEKHSDLISSIA